MKLSGVGAMKCCISEDELRESGHALKCNAELRGMSAIVVLVVEGGMLRLRKQSF